MIYTTLLLGCKVIIGLVFAISSISKLQDIEKFVEVIRGFRLLPEPLLRSCAILFLLCEMAVVPLLFVWPMLAFLLATILLIAFSAALASVILRKIQTPCNCFGSSQQLVSVADLIRNGGFLACALCGLRLALGPESNAPIMPLHAAMVSIGSMVFVLIGMQASEIYRLFQPQ